MEEEDDAYVEIRDEASHGDGPATSWEVVVHSIREVCVFARDAQEQVVRKECECAGDCRDCDAEEDSTLLERPWYGNGAAAYHGVPCVEYHHKRAELLVILVLFCWRAI